MMICRKMTIKIDAYVMYNIGASCRGGRFLNDVFGRHEQRIDVLEAVELALIDLSDEAWVVRRELHRLVGELRREVGEVPLALEPWPVRRRDLLLLEQFPLDGLEEGVGHDLHEAGLLVAAQPPM